MCTDSSSAASSSPTIISRRAANGSYALPPRLAPYSVSRHCSPPPTVVAHRRHLCTLNDWVSVMMKTQFARPKLRSCPTVSCTPLNVFHNAEKLHRDLTKIPSDPHVPGASTVCWIANAMHGIPSLSQNALNAGLRSLFSAIVACPNRHLASGWTCAQRQYSSGLMSSRPHQLATSPAPLDSPSRSLHSAPSAHIS